MLTEYGEVGFLTLNKVANRYCTVHLTVMQTALKLHWNRGKRKIPKGKLPAKKCL